MKAIFRKPKFNIEIVRPDYNSKTYSTNLVVNFVSSEITKDDKSSTALISYTFSESLDPISSDFSLNIIAEKDSNGRTWIDKIFDMDLVFISEFDVIRYVGYIKQRSYAADISSDGSPERRITIQGGSLGSLLNSFKIVLDQALYVGNSTANTASTALMSMLSSEWQPGGKFSGMIKSIANSFLELTLKFSNSNSTGVKGVIDKLVDLHSAIPDKFVVQYPMSLSLYQRGENSIWDLLSNIAHPPVNELFGRWNSDRSVYELIFRQAPFEPADWKQLVCNIIPPIIIPEYNLSFSNDDVFTFYLCCLVGSGIDKNKAVVLTPGEKKRNLYEIDEEKWSKYGYRPLIADFRYFNRSKIKEYSETFSLIVELSSMLKRWFSKNDELLSGTITIMTVDEKDEQTNLKNPRIGEKLKLMQTEFYIESSEHSGTYGGPMQSKLGLSRGYEYDNNGNMVKKPDYIAHRLQ